LMVERIDIFFKPLVLGHGSSVLTAKQWKRFLRKPA